MSAETFAHDNNVRQAAEQTGLAERAVPALDAHVRSRADNLKHKLGEKERGSDSKPLLCGYLLTSHTWPGPSEVSLHINALGLD